MERALNAVVDHCATVADVRAEVFAVRFQNMQFTRIVAVGDQIFAEVPQRPDLPDGEFGGPPDHEPAGDLPGERNPHAGASDFCWILNSLQYRFQQFVQHAAREPYEGRGRSGGRREPVS